ncbi:probable elastin-binding protein EbpS [Argopecten irradians]|uniref:probable elastin-binding protein EbpS n=1 Tax=Argopecten irradians TaxID=31199 RepID=UPI0037109F81
MASLQLVYIVLLVILSLSQVADAVSDKSTTGLDGSSGGSGGNSGGTNGSSGAGGSDGTSGGASGGSGNTKAPPPPNSDDDSSPAPGVIGGVVGGCTAVFIIIIVVIVIYCGRNRRGNQDQTDAKQDINVAYGKPDLKDAEQGKVSDKRGEPYTNISQSGQNEGNVYDELNGNIGTISTGEETEYCYISESDIIAAQRQSAHPIPTVRNTQSGKQINSFSSTVGTESNNTESESNEQNRRNSGKQELQNDNLTMGQDGSPQIPSPNGVTTPHEYLVLEPEHTKM